MRYLWDLLRLKGAGLFDATRQNHALEHATVAVLLRQLEHPARLLGRATTDGFYLHADLPTALIERVAHEALERMQKGEDHLAVSPFCGTNIIIAGAMATLACLVTLGTDSRLRRLPTAIAAATGAIVLAQPIGLMAQRHFTTTSDLRGLRIVGVTCQGVGARTVHKVETARDAA